MFWKKKEIPELEKPEWWADWEDAADEFPIGKRIEYLATVMIVASISPPKICYCGAGSSATKRFWSYPRWACDYKLENGGFAQHYFTLDQMLSLM